MIVTCKSQCVLKEKLKNVAKHFLLITIFGELGKDSMLDAQRVDVKPLESEALQDIFAGYEIPKEKQTWLADLCQGITACGSCNRLAR